MGEVFRATDLRLGRSVALKVLPREFVRDPDRLRRFETEARAASALNHPNIATIYEAGLDDDVPYIAMELVEGRRLRDILTGVPLPPAEVIDIAAQITAGLAKAHSAGVIHRDLKPENIMLSEDGFVKILDFGLAKVNPPSARTSQDSTQTMTQAGVVVGTTAYMSPEQACGRELDGRSDQFALGIILYEMVSGRNPFRGDTAVDTMAAVLEREPESLDSRNSTASPELAAIIARCLRKNPEARFSTTAEVAARVKELREGNARIVRRIPRNRAPLWIGIITVILLIGVLGGWYGLKQSRNAGAERHRLVAVRRFKNISGDVSRDYAVAGLSEEIRDRLSRVAGLRVISAGAVSRYGDGEIKRLGAETGAGTVVEGSVRLNDSRIRIGVTLVDTRTEQTLWADQFERRPEDLFDVQSEIAERVAYALQARLDPVQKTHVDRAPTRNLAAYDLYLRAKQLGRPYTPTNDRAIEMLRQAVQLDPNFSDAMAELSLRLGFRAVYRNTGLSEEAVRWAERAVSADSKSAAAYHALAGSYALLGRLSVARETFLRALELNPNHTLSMNDLANVDNDMGRFEEALQWSRRALLLSPNTTNGYYHVAGTLAYFGDRPTFSAFVALWHKRTPTNILPDPEIVDLLAWGRTADAMALARQSAKKRPEVTVNQLMLAETAYLTGDADAERLTEPLFRASPGPRFENWGIMTESPRTRYACLLLKRGDRNRAIPILADAKREIEGLLAGGIDTPFAHEELAAIEALRGDKQAAVSAYQKAYTHGWRFVMLTVRNPAFDSIRDMPEFQALVAKMTADVERMRAQSTELGEIRERTIPYLNSLK